MMDAGSDYWRLSAPRRWWAHARTSLFWIVIVAFGVRFGYIVIGHTYHFRSDKKILAQPVNEEEFRFWLRDGPHRTIARSRPGIQQSLQRAYRPHRLGTAALSFSDRGCLPRVWSLQSGFSSGSAEPQ